MSLDEAETRFRLIDPVLREKGCVSPEQVTLETVLTPAPVEVSGPKGRRRRGPGCTTHLLCVHPANALRSVPVAVLEARREPADPLQGMQQSRGYADDDRLDAQETRDQEKAARDLESQALANLARLIAGEDRVVDGK